MFTVGYLGCWVPILSIIIRDTHRHESWHLRREDMGVSAMGVGLQERGAQAGQPGPAHMANSATRLEARLLHTTPFCPYQPHPTFERTGREAGFFSLDFQKTSDSSWHFSVHSPWSFFCAVCNIWRSFQVNHHRCHHLLDWVHRFLLCDCTVAHLITWWWSFQNLEYFNFY